MKPRARWAELEERVDAELPAIVELRRALHRLPEAGFEERRTAEAVREALHPLPLQTLPSPLPTATVALLSGGRAGGGAGALNVTLRADIDALRLEEATGAPWASTHPGFAHACGHDGHAAMLVGAARVLSGLAARLAGSVRFVFQPAEEELGGGRRLVEAGLLEAAPRAGAVFALHGWPGLPLGSLASRPGAMMAAADRFRLVVRGRGGHGAQPHRTVDPVVTAARVIEAWQTIPSRNIDPLQPAVLSVCTIHGGNASNVIPAEVVLEGTTRYFDPALQELFRRRMEEVAGGTCAAAGAESVFDYRPGYVPLVNDPVMVEAARDAVTEALGARSWIADPPPSMGAEDFSYYLQKVPGAYLWLGLGEDRPGLHHPAFDFPDEALRSGTLALCAVAWKLLGD